MSFFGDIFVGIRVGGGMNAGYSCSKKLDTRYILRNIVLQLSRDLNIRHAMGRQNHRQQRH